MPDTVQVWIEEFGWDWNSMLIALVGVCRAHFSECIESLEITGDIKKKLVVCVVFAKGFADSECTMYMYRRVKNIDHWDYHLTLICSYRLLSTTPEIPCILPRKGRISCKQWNQIRQSLKLLLLCLHLFLLRFCLYLEPSFLCFCLYSCNLDRRNSLLGCNLALLQGKILLQLLSCNLERPASP